MRDEFVEPLYHLGKKPPSRFNFVLYIIIKAVSCSRSEHLLRRTRQTCAIA